MDDSQLSFYGFTRPPFGPVTETAEVFSSYSQSELIDAVAGELRDGRGVIAIQGAHGVGKTSFMPVLTAALQVHRARCFSIDGVSACPASLQRLLGDAVAVRHSFSGAERAPRRLILLVDDAEALSSATCLYLWNLLQICQIKAISFQLVLLGDLGVWAGLDSPALAAMRRATLPRYLMPCLSEDEAPNYLDHKLSHAGRSLRDVMTRSATMELLDRAQCNPDQLNALTERALAHSYEQGRRRVNLRRLRQALANDPAVEPGDRRTAWVPWAAGATALMLAACITGAIGLRNGAVTLRPPAALADAPPATAILPVSPAPPPPTIAPHIPTSDAAAPAAPSSPASVQGAALAAADQAAAEAAMALPSEQVVAPPPQPFAIAAPQAITAAAPPPAPVQPAELAANPVPGPAAALRANAGDTMAKLIRSFYHGAPPPVSVASLANDTTPLKPGTLVVLPAQIAVAVRR